MLNNVIGLAGYKFHFKEAKCCVNTVEFVHDRFYLLVFLVEV